MNNDAFSSLHPALNFFFYIFIIACSMFFMHPIVLLIGLLSSFSYVFYLKGFKAMKFTIFGILPLILVGACLNPLFNHQGVTILRYLSDGNPLTLESIIYGFAAAVMFMVVLLWFSAYNASITSDKFLYLFGALVPKFSLVLSLSLRFVPLYQTQLKKIRDSQRAVGRDLENGNLLEKIKNGLAIFSILVTWALENAIITADSMQARGYGLKGRTNYSLYRFGKRDFKILMILLTCACLILMGFSFGFYSVRYFPSIKYREISLLTLFIYLPYVLFCNFPLMLNIVEDYRWKRIKSTI